MQITIVTLFPLLLRFSLQFYSFCWRSPKCVFVLCSSGLNFVNENETGTTTEKCLQPKMIPKSVSVLFSPVRIPLNPIKCHTNAVCLLDNNNNEILTIGSLTNGLRLTVSLCYQSERRAFFQKSLQNNKYREHTHWTEYWSQQSILAKAELPQEW